jgi:excisionase family DNA binding protein
MAGRKVYCGVVEGLVYDDRCLLKLSKMIEDNKTCENCILRELERAKLPKTKVAISNISDEIKISGGIKDKFGMSEVPDRKRNYKRRPRKKSTGSGQSKRMYSTKELSELLGKAERTVREHAQMSRIPAHKIGPKWRFNKEEIDRWVSERKDGAYRILHTKQSEELPESLTSPGSPSSSEDPLFCTIETKEG